MHEVTFANAVLKDIEKQLEPGKEVEKVIIELGELVGIEDDHLLEALQKISSLNFEIVVKESYIKCPCGYEGRAQILERLHDQVIWNCPWCDDSIDVMEVIEGDKILIKKVIYK